MSGRLGRDEARRALRRALVRRTGKPLGSPLQELYARRFDEPARTEAVAFWGDRMQVVMPELVSCELYEYGVIEPALSALFVESVAETTVVFDVGAHYGYYSVLASALGATTFAFEPSKVTIPILLANVHDDAVVVPLGLWSTDTTLHLKDFGLGHSAVNTFLSPKDENLTNPEATYAVKVTTIDTYVEKVEAAPDLIKIDAEGAELAVLQGATRTIEFARPLITVEVGDTSVNESRSAIEFALELGYVAYELGEAGLRTHLLRDAYSYGNVLLVPDGMDPPRLPALLNN